MINLYKRMVLWNCRVLTHIPGYRAYGRFMLRCYTNRFWTTWFINVGISIITYIGLMRLLGWYVEDKAKKDMAPTADPEVFQWKVYDPFQAVK